MRLTSVKRSRLTMATWRRSITTAARVPSPDTASDVGRDVPGRRIDASTANVAASMTSSALGRAAYSRSPSALTASAAGTPGTTAAPTGSRVPRSNPTTRLPAATYPREPSGATATPRLRPPTGTRATTRFVATSVSVAVPWPVATSTTRADASAGTSRPASTTQTAAGSRRTASFNQRERSRLRPSATFAPATAALPQFSGADPAALKSFAEQPLGHGLGHEGRNRGRRTHNDPRSEAEILASTVTDPSDDLALIHRCDRGVLSGRSEE